MRPWATDISLSCGLPENTGIDKIVEPDRLQAMMTMQTSTTRIVLIAEF